MAKAKPTVTPKAPKLEFEPDAWERFESLIRSAAKMGHQPHKPTPPQPKAVVKKRAKKQAPKRA